jgi:uncharacterized RDD family membrane protein YckC
MQYENPYQSPSIAADDAAAARTQPIHPPSDPLADLTADTVVPRYVAASLDMLLMMLIAVIAAKQFSNDWPLLQTAVALAIYPAYFLLWEGLTARTPGKLLTGLVVVNFHRQRCSWRQTGIRTLFRLLEVNPILLGALPAAISIVTSKYRQRLGDKAAKTIVVPGRRLKKRKTAPRAARHD